MIEKKYNTKDIRHINEKNQEYIAEGNRMTKENKIILDTDKLPNFANTFIDINTYKRLEQENKELKAYKDVNEDFKKAWDELNEKHKRYRSALEEIREINNKWLKRWMNDSDEIAGFEEMETKIKEVLQ